VRGVSRACTFVDGVEVASSHLPLYIASFQTTRVEPVPDPGMLPLLIAAPAFVAINRGRTRRQSGSLRSQEHRRTASRAAASSFTRPHAKPTRRTHELRNAPPPNHPAG
jgi:hypothetical protein